MESGLAAFFLILPSIALASVKVDFESSNANLTVYHIKNNSNNNNNRKNPPNSVFATSTLTFNVSITTATTAAAHVTSSSPDRPVDSVEVNLNSGGNSNASSSSGDTTLLSVNPELIGPENNARDDSGIGGPPTAATSSSSRNEAVQLVLETRAARNSSHDDAGSLPTTATSNSIFSTIHNATKDQIHLLQSTLVASGQETTTAALPSEINTLTSSSVLELEQQNTTSFDAKTTSNTGVNVNGIAVSIENSSHRNMSELCSSLKCQHGSHCSTDGHQIWCTCSWAFSGHLCENALPLYLALGLVAIGVLMFFFVGLSILLCIKLGSIKSEPQSNFDRKFDLAETFNKTDSTAIYADPAASNYYGSICHGTLMRNRVNNNAGSNGNIFKTSYTLPRPRITLESFENNGNGGVGQSSPMSATEINNNYGGGVYGGETAATTDSMEDIVLRQRPNSSQPTAISGVCATESPSKANNNDYKTTFGPRGRRTNSTASPVNISPPSALIEISPKTINAKSTLISVHDLG